MSSIVPIPCRNAPAVVYINNVRYAGFVSMAAAQEAVKRWRQEGMVRVNKRWVPAGWEAVRFQHVEIVDTIRFQHVEIVDTNASD